MSHIVVIGGGQAGSVLVGTLRSKGFTGAVTLIGAEAVLPYQRPPLSKKYLLGEMELERLYLRPKSFYEEHNITLRLGHKVQSINVTDKTVKVDNETLFYDELVFTTGSDPRFLPSSIGGDLGGVYVVRSLSDVDQMRSEFVPDAHVLIIGGGYIGLEAAAVARSKGLRVTVVEMAERILQRVASKQTSDYFRNLHTKHGVKILENIGLERLTGKTRVDGAILSDGTKIDVDFVIAGIGITPSVDLARLAGVHIENGIKIDAKGRTNLPNIWAAGDCASFPYHGKYIRLESVPNAIDQAEIIARNILGEEVDYIARPWFWSDQYDVKLQIAGLNSGYDDVIERRTEESNSFWYYQGERLLAVDAMNDPRGYMVAKRLIEAGKTVDKKSVADPSVNLKSLLK